MQEEEKPQKVVKINTVVASGIAAALAALFTSGLGVAGTLIGAALTAMTINLGSAILSAQIEKASTRIASLPDTVRGRLSTQQIRTPGKRSPEPDDPAPAAEQATAPAAREGFFGRLRSIPRRLRSMPSSGRRRVLLASALAGLVATFIGLAAVTGVEATAGETLSCLVWGECQEEESASGSTGGARTSIGRFFGGSYAPGTEESPSGEQQQVMPGDGQPTPQQPAGEPVQPGAGDGAGQPGVTPQSPGEAPDQEVSPPAQPGAPRGAQPGADGKVEPSPPALPTGEAPAKGQGRIPEREPEDKGPERGQQKEDRGDPGPL